MYLTKGAERTPLSQSFLVVHDGDVLLGEVGHGFILHLP